MGEFDAYFARRAAARSVWTGIALDHRNRDAYVGTLYSLSTAPDRYAKDAVNSAADKARDKIAERIRERVNLDAYQVDPLVTVAKTAQSKSDTAIVRISGKPIPLIEFGVEQGEAGVFAKTERDGTPELYQSAFLATMPDGTYGVYEREWVGTERADRLPLDQVNGPSLAESVNSNTLLAEWVERDAETALVDELATATAEFTSLDGGHRAFAEISAFFGY